MQQSKGFVPKILQEVQHGHTEHLSRWEHHNKLPNIDKIYPHEILKRAYDAVFCVAAYNILYRKLGSQMNHHIHLEQCIKLKTYLSEVFPFNIVVNSIP